MNIVQYILKSPKKSLRTPQNLFYCIIAEIFKKFQSLEIFPKQRALCASNLASWRLVAPKSVSKSHPQ